MSGELSFNGWGVPPNEGASRPATTTTAPQSHESIYKWGGILLFDIEQDPLEEHDISTGHLGIVDELVKALHAHNSSHIDQSTFSNRQTLPDKEPCGNGLTCARHRGSV